MLLDIRRNVINSGDKLKSVVISGIIFSVFLDLFMEKKYGKTKEKRNIFKCMYKINYL